MNEAALTGIRVVLIDENFSVRHSGEGFLSQAGCRVILAEDSFDGLSKITYSQPDMVLVGAGMPQLDGYQICSLIRKHLPHHNMPVILLTGEDSPFDPARGEQAGTNLFLAKPFDRERLVKAVAAHIPQSSEEKKLSVKNLLQVNLPHNPDS